MVICGLSLADGWTDCAGEASVCLWDPDSESEALRPALADPRASARRSKTAYLRKRRHPHRVNRRLGPTGAPHRPAQRHDCQRITECVGRGSVRLVESDCVRSAKSRPDPCVLCGRLFGGSLVVRTTPDSLDRTETPPRPSFRQALPPPISWDSPRRAPGRVTWPPAPQACPANWLAPTRSSTPRRPEAWASLSQTDAALLDFLRRGGRTSELSPENTVRRTLILLSEGGRFDRLLNVAQSEPHACVRCSALSVSTWESPPVPFSPCGLH